MNRRDLIAGTAGLVAGSFLSTARAGGHAPALRCVHITDCHITADKDGAKGVAAMFAHVAKHRKPDLILNTGDTVMGIDGKVGAVAARAQLDLWRNAAKAAPAPIVSALGNHDVWDGFEPDEAWPAAKRGFGPMIDLLGMPAADYSLDRGGWHFIVLNSCGAWPNAYGALTAAQFAWLKADLAKVPADRPICVLSHFPIVSVTSSLYGDEQRRGNDVVVPGGWQHADCWAISELFRKHPNVKLCLSGHMHTQDRCEYRGVWYVCGGAVSGSWWDGSEYGFPPCYGGLDLFADGTFTYEFIDYGWAKRGWRGQELGVPKKKKAK